MYGTATVNVVASTALHTRLSLSATPGSLDDLSVAGSILVAGATLAAINGTSGTTFLNWPQVAAPAV